MTKLSKGTETNENQLSPETLAEAFDRAHAELEETKAWLAEQKGKNDEDMSSQDIENDT